MVGEWWTDSIQGWVDSSVERDPVTNKRKAGQFESFVSPFLTGGNVTGKGSVERVEAGDRSRKGEQAWDNAGAYRSELEGMGITQDSSAESIQGGVRKITQKEQADSPQTKAILSGIKNSGTQLELTKQGLEDSRTEASNRHTQQITALNNQNDISKATLQQNLDFRKMDKGDKADERATALEIEQMRGAREDKRLKMQHDRYYADKKSSSMQALVAGLAALGAAFAL